MSKVVFVPDFSLHILTTYQIKTTPINFFFDKLQKSSVMSYGKNTNWVDS